MTDIIKSDNNVPIRFADMGDGTFAEVTATSPYGWGPSISLAGKSLVSTGTSVTTLIPLDSTTLQAPSYLRIAVTDPGYVRVSNTESNATATDVLVNPAEPLYINSKNKRFVSFLSLGASSTANIQAIDGASFDMIQPALDLNFSANTYTINGDSLPFSSVITFSRASTGSFIDIDGLIKYAPANEPRFDRNPLTGVSRGVLIEEQRTNLLTYSEMFGEAIWSKNDCSMVLNSTASPDGNVTADKIVENSATASHFVQQSITAVSGTSYTVSFFVKAAERSFCLVGLSGGGLAEVLVGVNLTTGAVVSTLNSPDATSVTQLRNGWFRISLTKAATASVTLNARAYASQDGQQANRSYLGDGASGIFVWGGELEAGAFATSYIPTVASQATRLAESSIIDGTRFAAIYNSAEGSVIAEFTVNNTQNAKSAAIVDINDTTTNNRVVMRAQTAGGTSQVTIRSSGTTVANFADISGAGVLSAGTLYKFASCFRINSFASTINGGALSSDTDGAVPVALSVLRVGSEVGNIGHINGHIRKIMYVPRRLFNAELQAVTL